MKKVFSKSDICTNVIEHINCNDEIIEKTIIGLLSHEFSPYASYKFRYVDEDTIEVDIEE